MLNILSGFGFTSLKNETAIALDPLSLLNVLCVSGKSIINAKKKYTYFFKKISLIFFFSIIKKAIKNKGRNIRAEWYVKNEINNNSKAKKSNFCFLSPLNKQKIPIVVKNNARFASNPALEKCICQGDIAKINPEISANFLLPVTNFTNNIKNPSVKVPEIVEGSLTASVVLPKTASVIQVT